MHMPPLSPAHLCKKAQVKSCTECIRVHQDCAYCTDEVSLCLCAGQPRATSPCLAHLWLWPTAPLPPPQPGPGPGGCGEGARVRNIRGK